MATDRLAVRKITVLLSLLGILLIAFALRTWVLNDMSIYHDELRQYVRNLQDVPLLKIPLASRIGTQVAPLVMAKISTLVLGECLFALRWPGVMLSVMSVALTYRIGSWLLGREVGLGAAFLLTLSLMSISYTYMFKGYNGTVFFVLLAYALSIRGLHRREVKWWWLAAGSWMLATYSHLYAALAVVGLFGIVVIWHVSMRCSWRSLLKAMKLPVVSALLGIFAATMAAVGPPMVRYLLDLWTGPSSVPTELPYKPQNPARAVSFISMLRQFSGEPDVDDVVWDPAPLYLMSGTATLAIALSAAVRRAFRIAGILGAILLPYAAYLIINWLRPDILGRERYFLYALPFFYMLVASFPWLVGQSVSRQRVTVLRIAIVATVVLLGVVSFFWIPTLVTFFSTGTMGNWRPVGKYLADRLQPTDLVICAPFEHSWQHRYVVQAGVCNQNLEFWLRTRRTTSVYPVLSLASATDYNTLTADPRVLGRYGNAWMVVFDVPAIAAVNDYTAESYPEWNTYGRTLVIPSQPDSRLFDTLIRYLQILRAWSPDVGSQLFYNLRLAQLASMSGNENLMQEAWQQVELLRTMIPEADDEISLAYSNIRNAPVVRAPENRMSASIGDTIRFDGFTVRPGTHLRPGDTLRLLLFWHALDKPSDNYTVFVHITDAAGRIVLQDDFLPSPNTTGWWPGDSVWEERALTISEEMSPGKYEISTGMYLLADMQRLPVSGQDVRDGAIVLASLLVEQD
jgi:hypothetical protein